MSFHFYKVRFFKLFLWFVLSFAFLAACNAAEPTASPSPEQPLETVTMLPAPTDTPQPSPTAPEPLVVLLTAAESDASRVALLEALLAELAAQEGWKFETRMELPVSQDASGLQIVVALPPRPDLAQLASTYPQARFLGIGFSDLQAGDNLSLIGVGGIRPDQQGFLAGYLAAVITPNWRAGVISLSGDEASQAAQQGFINGAIFYCGLCRPAYPPFFQYPVYASFPADSQLDARQAAADTLIANAVETVYVAPGAADDALFVYLAEAGVKIIAGIDPPGGLENVWVASIQLDWAEALRQSWPALVAGDPGVSQEPPLVLSHVNQALLSPGRQQFVERMLAELADGFIDTGVMP